MGLGPALRRPERTPGNSKHPLRREHLDEFVGCYRPGERHAREETSGEENPDGRWRSYGYGELAKRDNKLNLDLFWIRDRSLEESDDLPEPEVLAQEIVEDLQAALEQFASVAERLREADET